MKKVVPTLLAIIIFLGAFAYYRHFEKNNENHETTDENIYVWQLNINKITDINISHENETIKLKRDGQNWLITHPIEYPADNHNLSMILGRFSSPIATALVEENSNNLTTYGIDSSKTTLTFINDEGASNTLILGDEAPLSKGIYVCNDNNKNIYTISSKSLDNISFDLDFLRDRMLLSFKKEYIDKIVIENEGKTFEIISKEEDGVNNWYSNDKILDEATVRSLIIALNIKTIEEFVKDNASAEDLKEYGLKNPRAVITIHLYDADNPTLNLYIGNTDDSFVYVTKDKKFIYKVQASTLLAEDLRIESFYKKDNN
ncbi:MAG TPA: DUF4340 domain-containing protein [Defluviitaleaceae bacterium]|jgi:hypothetical protein|nr:DUF4340 domain-containing protein [Candidatus Epulonipiscium sp.]HOA79638.1 DUF4340 domain-containing protein [Defluviitaleaceae bacterium]